MLGQPTLIVMFLVAGSAWLAARGHRFGAGLLLAATLIKPQLTFMVAPVLLAGGELTMCAGWAAGTALLVFVSIALVGVTGVQHGLALERAVQVYPFNSYLTLNYVADPTVRSGFLSPTARVPVVNPVTVGLELAAAAAALLVAYLNRGRGIAVLIAVGLVASLLAAPHVHEDDLAVLIVAAWLQIPSAPSIAHRAWPLVAAIGGEAPLVTTPILLLISVVGWIGLAAWPRRHLSDSAVSV